MAYIKIENGRSKRGPRHLRIAMVNGELYTACRRREIIIRHHGKMNVDIIPRIDEERALAIWVTAFFLLFETVRFGDGSLFTHGFGKRIIVGNFFSLMARRTLIFHRCHDGLFDWKRLVERFWERRHGEEKGMEKAF